MLADIKENPIKSQDILCSWIRKLIFVKMITFQNLISRLNAIPIKISAGFFVEINKLTVKCTWKLKRPRIANTIFKNKENFGELTSYDNKTYFKLPR